MMTNKDYDYDHVL